MAIPFVDDLIEWLYQFLGRIGWVLTVTGLLLCTVMIGVGLDTGELPRWSALDLGIQSPHTSIGVIDSLLTLWWSVRLGIPISLLAMGMSLHLSIGRRARQMAQAEAELYAPPAPQVDHASLRTRWALFQNRSRSR